MKTPSFFRAIALVLFVSLFATSCSDSDSSSTNNNDDAYFNYQIDGQTVALTNNVAVKRGTKIAVSGTAANGSNFSIEFNETGNLDAAMCFNITNTGASIKNNFEYNKKEYFTFELISVENGMVKASFSGKLYDDSTDLSSTFSQVEGEFYLPYTTETEQYPLSLTAKINGNTWNYSTASQYSGSDGASIDYSSDDAYTLMVYFDPETVAQGTHAFTSNSVERVILAKYNSEVEYSEEYISSAGTLNITSVTTGVNYLTIEGTFNFTATHPETGETISVTNAQFKGYYSSF